MRERRRSQEIECPHPILSTGLDFITFDSAQLLERHVAYDFYFILYCAFRVPDRGEHADVTLFYTVIFHSICPHC